MLKTTVLRSAVFGAFIYTALSLTIFWPAQASGDPPSLTAPHYGGTFEELYVSSPVQQLAELLGADSLRVDGNMLIATALPSANLTTQGLQAERTELKKRITAIQQHSPITLLSPFKDVQVIEVKYGTRRLLDYAQRIRTALTAANLPNVVYLDPLGDQVMVKTPGATRPLQQVLQNQNLPHDAYRLYSTPVTLSSGSGSTPPSTSVERLSNSTQLSSGLSVDTTQWGCTYGYTGVNSSGTRVGITARHCIGSDTALRHPQGGNVLGTAQVSGTTSGMDAVVITLGSALQSLSLSSTSRSIAVPVSTSDDTIASRIDLISTASGLSQPTEIHLTGRSSFIRKWKKGTDYGEVIVTSVSGLAAPSGFTITGSQECIQLLHPADGEVIGRDTNVGDSGGPIYTPQGTLLGIASNSQSLSKSEWVNGAITLRFYRYVCYVPVNAIANGLGINVLTK